MEIVILWAVCAVLCVVIMQNKGQSGCIGLLLGVLLGVLGLIICAVWPAKGPEAVMPPEGAPELRRGRRIHSRSRR